MKYEGGFLNGKKEGYGTKTWADGQVYKGYFSRDKPNG